MKVLFFSSCGAWADTEQLLPSPPLRHTRPHEHELGAVDDDELDRAEKVRVCTAAPPAPSRCSDGGGASLVLLVIVAPAPANEAAQGEWRRDEDELNWEHVWDIFAALNVEPKQVRRLPLRCRRPCTPPHTS